MKTYKTDIPGDSLTRQYLPADYTDAFACEVIDAKPLSAEDIIVSFWTVMPGWVNSLFKLRNALVRPFGLKTGGEEGRIEDMKNVILNGGQVGLTSLAAKSEGETVLLLSDKHLDAYMSVHIAENGKSQTITLITLVHYHNALGKVYFFFVRPFHKIIASSMLKSTLNRII